MENTSENAINWDSAFTADQQARTIITIQQAEICGLQVKVNELVGALVDVSNALVAISRSLRVDLNAS